MTKTEREIKILQAKVDFYKTLIGPSIAATLASGIAAYSYLDKNYHLFLFLSFIAGLFSIVFICVIYFYDKRHKKLIDKLYD